ncbi:hypothetical protein BaRGS_00007902 [Batillaria attramentaria]|uniref:Fucosyltransferase n=1 Tax=Batillaria attramentaria TaxID=370345 RepID=A0ABD0LNW3_9CAEN
MYRSLVSESRLYHCADDASGREAEHGCMPTETLLFSFFTLHFRNINSCLRFEPGFTPASAAELEEARNEPIHAPVILWWTGFTGEPGAYKTCGSVECFFTIKRKYKNHPKLKVFMFYASDLQATDLPLPREPHHEWAVLHEESPKNNILFSFEDMLVLFNHTSTFRRESDYPITTQYLISEQWLLSTKYYKSVQAKNQLQREKGLAPIVYVHSHCDPPSDRDHYVKLLMEYIPVDSYGLCLNNKKMPQHLQQPMESMDHSDFYELLSQYKFALAMENAVCEDYITEKLWRPLMLGVVPIVYGSPSVTVFMFYASDLQATDLPLPREPHHEWAVLHEESPKNNILFSFEDMLVLFNHTSTFRRESDYPITTQHLISEQWLLSKKYYKSVQAKNQLQREKGLAPIVYVHSDCDPPSDRDHYVKLLMEYIPVDSYGLCLNNKKMPQHLQQPVESMDHSDFYELLSQYKFALAMENAVCEDYITEKLWRPLMLGVVPIAYGSPSVTDLLPSNSSAVVITDFQDVKHLAQHIHKLNTDDAAYERYLTWKKEGSINPLLQQHLRHRDWTPDGDDPATKDFISGFECFVCQRIHENLRRQKKGLLPLHHVANLSHYGCPVPHLFDEKGVVGKESDWKYDWMSAGKLAHALRWYVENKVPFTEEELHKQAVVLSEEHPVQ